MAHMRAGTGGLPEPAALGLAQPVEGAASEEPPAPADVAHPEKAMTDAANPAATVM